MPRAANKEAVAERRQRAASLYAQGMSLEDVGGELGVSGVLVARDLATLGVARRTVGQPRKHPKPQERECALAGCQLRFTPGDNNRDQRFCTREHAAEAKALYPKPSPRRCVVCGEEFIPPRNRPDQKTCGKGCADVERAKYPQPEPRECAHPDCHVVFTPAHPSAAVEGEGVYCSDACRDSAPQRREKIRLFQREDWDKHGVASAGLTDTFGPDAKKRWKGRRAARTRASGITRRYTELQARGVIQLAQSDTTLGYGRLSQRTGLTEMQVRTIVKHARERGELS
jgi:predicted nucleic acid-binding Zn ribbon protein